LGAVLCGDDLPGLWLYAELRFSIAESFMRPVVPCPPLSRRVPAS